MKFFTFFLLSLIPFVSSAVEQPNSNSGSNTETAIFAGGCFWCMEPPFDKLNGVISTTSGYTAGHKKDPSYKEVSAERTGHTEAVKIIFNPQKISYQALLKVFWKNIDPLARNRQFCDSGTQYRSGIYFKNASQEKAARESLQQLVNSKKLDGEIVTEIQAADTFYPAEDYHQNYYQKNPLRYKFYRYSCCRDQRLEELWGK